ncbi:aminodeoxychorismate/anthranilate synthase component II [Apibacter muscae]|uniref:Aminodeoxychorismate/anthranilate synthase component II n=1 Tax=Apibacter muscae TaxID=2509004 RepID=A0A563DFV0_9FLAO|nr:aminodeoxychorismate/anthranilate synthase component II [Apibacter muscae]TWP29002.1 aminodeoxychorismate/anthranilate synthase component II [Apibacter muscae]
MKVKIALIDNYDSFTGNLFQLFDENLNCTLEVIPNDRIQMEDLIKFDKIVLSPGPDIPKNTPNLFSVIEEFKQTKSILGICLGHQAIVECLGGKLLNLEKVNHGIKKTIIINKQEKIFQNLPTTIEVGLYHSWLADKDYLPLSLKVTAESIDHSIMAVSHTTWDLKGVQFHPESFMTFYGRQIINNWIKQ